MEEVMAPKYGEEVGKRKEKLRIIHRNINENLKSKAYYNNRDFNF